MMKKILFILVMMTLCINAKSQTSLNQIVLFQKDSVNVPEFQIAQVGLLADYFKAHPKEMFFIGGFTSENTPPERVDSICEQRAQAVRKRLMEKFGVDCTYIIAIGVGVSRKSPEPEFNEKVEFFKK